MSVQPEFLFGRTVIYYDTGEVTRENICDILSKVLETHRKNALEIDRLYQKDAQG